jgi:hypothetical protein
MRLVSWMLVVFWVWSSSAICGSFFDFLQIQDNFKILIAGAFC